MKCALNALHAIVVCSCYSSNSVLHHTVFWPILEILTWNFAVLLNCHTKPSLEKLNFPVPGTFVCRNLMNLVNNTKNYK